MLEPLESRIAPATFIVTSLLEDGPGSLRDVIARANENPGADSIVFKEGLTGAIKLTSANGVILISDTLTIKGPGAAKLTIDAQNQTQIFLVNDLDTSKDSSLTVSGLAFFNGKALRPSPDVANPGGAIRSVESLKIRGCAFFGNQASSNGGAISLEQGGSIVPLSADIRGSSFLSNTANGSNGGALAIVAHGGAILKNNRFTDSFASNVGGAVQINAGLGRVSVENCQFLENTGFVAGGGGSIVGDTIVVRDCTFDANSAEQQSGGLEVSARRLLFERSTFIQNQAETQAGGLDVGGIGDSLIIRSCNFVGNTCFAGGGGDGGGLRIAGSDSSVAHIIASNISDNTAGRGGGVFVVPGTGLLEIVGSKITGNRASGDGGGVMVDENATTRDGADLKIVRSKIAGNVSDSNNGGGVALFGDGKFTLLSSQVTQNIASLLGGGVALLGTNQAKIIGSLIAENSAEDGGGVFTDVALEVRATKVLDNTAVQFGGGIQANTRLTLNLTIVSGNLAKIGGGLFLTQPATMNGSKVTGNVSLDGEQIVIN
jgi:fibronectin-binding autotransporter adhesin